MQGKTKTFYPLKADLQVNKKQAFGENLICPIVWWEVRHHCKFTADQMKLTNYAKLEVTAKLPLTVPESTEKLPSDCTAVMVKYTPASTLLLSRR